MGVLFRDSESEMRREMVKSDAIECVISLGPNLFYNSSMVSCLLITNNNKEDARKGKVLFIEAVNEVRNEKTISYLDNKHIVRIHSSYKIFEAEDGFSKIVNNEDIIKDKNARLSVQLFVKKSEKIEEDFEEVLSNLCEISKELSMSFNSISNVFKGM
jgi:type I restriction enzyme M protein